MGTPRLAELKGFTHGHPAKRAELGFTFRSVPPLGPLGRQPPVMAGSRKDQVGVGAGGGLCPCVKQALSLQSPCPPPSPLSTRQVPAAPLPVSAAPCLFPASPGRGLAPGSRPSPQASTEGLLSKTNAALCFSPAPHPASASPSLLLI